MIYPKHDTRMMDYRKEENALAVNVAGATVDILDLIFDRPIKVGDHLDCAFLIEAAGGLAGGSLEVTATVVAPVSFTLLEPNAYLKAFTAGKTDYIIGWWRGLCLTGGTPFRFKIQGVCSDGDVTVPANSSTAYAWFWRP